MVDNAHELNTSQTALVTVMMTIRSSLVPVSVDISSFVKQS